MTPFDATIESLAKALSSVREFLKEFNEDQPRNDKGEFAGGGHSVEAYSVHGATNPDPKTYTSTGGGGFIHRSDAASIMYGRGSKQHLQAIAKYGLGRAKP